MNTLVLSPRAQRTLIALAACAVCLSTQAQPAVDATFSAGLGALDGSKADRALFGQYNGLHTSDNIVGMLGLDYSLRDPEAGKWVDFNGSNLLGDTRELNLVWKNPGSWKFIANYNELLRSDPNTLNTSLVGSGSTKPSLVSPSILPGAGIDAELKTKRSGLGLGFTKVISPTLQLQVDLKSENKEGKHAFSLAYVCPALQGSICNTMMAEPVNANHTQVEARASYALEKLHLTAGYYGSFYRNSNAALIPSGFITASPINQLPLALPPDNQAHQFDLSGSYDFAPNTHGTFKLAWSTATQNADFANAGLVGPALVGGTVVSSSGARVDTTLAKVGFTSRPLTQLSLLGDLRYENKDDQTPIFYYNTSGTSTNHQLPNTKVQGKLQASWQFDSDYRGTLGTDIESIDRGTYTASSTLTGISALRQNTRETTLRADLQRKLTNNVSGTIGVSNSHRDGSNWLQANTPAATYMPTQADRERNKVKLAADWQASEQLSLQFNAASGTDNYTAPTANGLRDTRMNQLGVDWAYALNDNWNMVGYLSQSTQTLNQAVYTGTVMAFDNTNLGVSLGITGKASSKIQLGANLSYVDDKSVFAQSANTSALASVATQLVASGGLPDVTYRQTALKLFATYALEKQSSLRFDLIHQRTSVNDWTWGNNGVPFTYSDGATMTQNPEQNVSFIGVTYVYRLP
jgi:MtrB/PioB family decaheme-associated outer membrane protein